jgi:hypothetical protein
VSYVGTGSLLTDEERAARLATAMLKSIDTWSRQVEEIADAAPPGNKRQALHLLRAMQQAKLALRDIADLPEEE